MERESGGEGGPSATVELSLQDDKEIRPGFVIGGVISLWAEAESGRMCNKFPDAGSEGTCYHCYAIGNTIDECPECVAKPWSEEFLEAEGEIEGPEKLLLPF